MAVLRCPCTSGETYAACCGPLHEGVPAPSAERLMRSRFSAFALGDGEYLLRSWHPSTRPEELVLEDGLRWYRLDIEQTERGGPFDTSGVVAFAAYYKGHETGVQRETSRFVREQGNWYYVEAV